MKYKDSIKERKNSIKKKELIWMKLFGWAEEKKSKKKVENREIETSKEREKNQ